MAVDRPAADNAEARCKGATADRDRRRIRPDLAHAREVNFNSHNKLSLCRLQDTNQCAKGRRDSYMKRGPL